MGMVSARLGLAMRGFQAVGIVGLLACAGCFSRALPQERHHESRRAARALAADRSRGRELPSVGPAEPRRDDSSQLTTESENNDGENAVERELGQWLTYRSAEPSHSTSIGGPSSGRLEGGVPLPLRTPGLVSNPRRPNPEAFYGTTELVDALVHAAAVVEREMPGGMLTVNDLSFAQGGPIDHHASHQAGRDADVLFYLLDAEGRPRPSVGAPIDPEGNGTDYHDLLDPSDDEPLRIDLARTWRFVQALLEDETALVQRIFVVEHVRAMLLEQAHRMGSPRSIVERFAEVTCQPRYPHDDHLHIRLFCTTQDLAAGCADSPPIYPWRLAQLEAAGVRPVVAFPRPRRRSTIVTHARARAEAPPMHESVRAFLARRARWSRQPHPGRPYCR